ncbi:MAG: fatty acid--CoA ligase, partial [Proteobacteria bacterium]|nr:fatty acid--CoA ligase [Pseudomonadota bacterium]
DARMGEVGMAFIVPRGDATLDEVAFKNWCREQMANYKVPRFIAIRDHLPTNASGKVLKYALRDEAAKTTQQETA